MMTDPCPSCSHDGYDEECPICGFRPHKWPLDVTFCLTCGTHIVHDDDTWANADGDLGDLDGRCPPSLDDLPNGWDSTPDEIDAVWAKRPMHTPRIMTAASGG